MLHYAHFVIKGGLRSFAAESTRVSNADKVDVSDNCQLA